LPGDYLPFEASPAVLGSAGSVLIVVALALLARDHSGSDVIAVILLLAFSVITGWLTFYGPEEIIEGGLSFIPASVSQALGRLLFGLGVVGCVGAAAMALRRLFR
jgi:hypothetical protein